MADVTRIIGRLGAARQRLLAAANAITEDQWQASPRPGSWSAAEVVAHLTMVEGRITDGAVKMLREAPRAVPLRKRLHVPVRLAEWRLIRAKSPIPLDPGLVADRKSMLERLALKRRHTLELLEETRERDLSAYRWPHPFFGSLNFYDWFRVIAHHEARHTKQIQEIVATFRK